MLELLLILILVIIGPFVLIPLGIMPEGRDRERRVLFPSDWTGSDAKRCTEQSLSNRNDKILPLPPPLLSYYSKLLSDFDFCVSVIRDIFNVQCWVGSNQGYLAWKDHGPRMWGQTACMVDFRLVPNPYQLEWDSLANKPLIRLARPIRLLLLAVTARTLCI